MANGETRTPHLHPSPDNTGEPVAWLHEILEPDGQRQKLYSAQVNNPWSHWTDAHMDQCKYVCTPLYLHPPAADAVVEVKPLSWGNRGGLWVTTSGLVDYRVSQPTNADVWRWATDENGPFSDIFSTADEAKAAAQADYETRIRSALSTRQQAGDGE